MVRHGDLSEYRRKRALGKTPEPRGEQTPSPRGESPLFVIQKHQATNLHYDLRLEVDGVLMSWAVPKGPSTDPSEKRLAVAVEDHPLDYADFEGTIPEDEYGGGTVIVWDTGTYRNLRVDDNGQEIPMAEAFDDGQIEVWLEGEKLRGGYVLINTKMRGERKNWLLIKMKDNAADAQRNPVDEEPQSVLTGRTLEEVADE